MIILLLLHLDRNRTLDIRRRSSAMQCELVRINYPILFFIIIVSQFFHRDTQRDHLPFTGIQKDFLKGFQLFHRTFQQRIGL